MKRVSLIDDAFLRLETRRQPLHIGMLLLFEPPSDAPPDFLARIVQRFGQSNTAVPPFNWRLIRKNGGDYWDEDQDFDVGHHFVHTALPKPGRIRDLLALVSRLHSGPLDRAYPLWRMYLVEGLEDRRIAVYLKIHHSLVDGIAGMRLIADMMAGNAEESLTMPAPWTIPQRRSKQPPLPVPMPAVSTAMAARSLAQEGIRSVMPVIKALRTSFRDYRSHNPDLVVAGMAPRCLLNQKVSATRRFAGQSYSAVRIKAVAGACNAAVNDVILAMCGGALRRYLLDLGVLPKTPLVAGVPVSVRGKNQSSSLGNEVAFTLTHLGTHMDDPVARLMAIKNCMDYNKRRNRELLPGQLLSYAALMLLPGAASTLLRFAPNNVLGNVVISHVPGPRKPLYWQGARLTGLYPLSLLFDYGALNITVVSRQDFVDFGLLACPKTVPGMQRLLEFLEDALKELEAAVLKPPAQETPLSTESGRQHSDEAVRLEA